MKNKSVVSRSENMMHWMKSLLLHTIVLGFLIFSLETFSGHSRSRIGNLKPNAEPIQAVAIDETEVKAEVARLNHETQKQKNALKMAEVAKLEVEKLKLQQQKMQSQQKQAMANLKLETEKEREALKVLQQKKEKQEKELKALQAQHQKQQEEQKMAEQQRLAQAQAKEQQAQMAAKARWINTERQKYMALIKQKIDNAWIRPPDSAEGLSCEVEIQVTPDGTVTGSKVVRSSGYFAFDRATEVAITRASPLPMPSDKSLIDDFRHFKLSFRQPE